MAKSNPRYGRGTGNPHPVDVRVGARVQQRRVLLGMTQTDLGDALGLSFQQVQKNESGTNRIGAGRLYDLARVLDVPVNFFFEDMPPETAAISPVTKGRGKAKKLPGYEPDLMVKRETLELVRAYYEIEDADVRQQVRELTKLRAALASAAPATPVRLVKAFKMAVFKLHNPSQRKRAVMRDAMKRAHLAYTKLLDAHLPDQDEIDRLAALPKRERPSTWIISHGFHSGHVWLVPAARTKTWRR